MNATTTVPFGLLSDDDYTAVARVLGPSSAPARDLHRDGNLEIKIAPNGRLIVRMAPT